MADEVAYCGDFLAGYNISGNMREGYPDIKKYLVEY